MLKKVTYPTGGYVQFEYEQNTYWDANRQVQPAKKSGSANAQGDDTFQSITRDYSFYNVVTQQIHLFTGASFVSTNGSVYDPVHNKGRVSVIDTEEDSEMWGSNVEPGSPVDVYLYLTAGHTYKFSVTTRGEGAAAQFHFDYYPDVARTISGNIETGGVRIAKTLIFDPVTGKTEATNYSYDRVNAPGISTGRTKFTPQYLLESTSRLACAIPCSFYTCGFGMLMSSSQNTLYPSGGNNIYYEYVTISRGDDFAFGAEEHHFLIDNDSPGRIVSGQPIMNAPYTNFGWQNGLEVGVKTFALGASHNFILTREVSHQYVQDNRTGRSVKALIARKRYSPVCPLDNVVLKCDDVNTHDPGTAYTVCTTGHMHIYSLGFISFSGRCIAPGANNHLVYENVHPCTLAHKNPGDSVAVYYALDHIDAIEYSSIAYWFYQNSTTETRYDENGLNPVTIVQQFYYDNPDHLQLTRTQTIQSDGKTASKQMWYTGDYGTIENMATLKNKNLVSLLMKTESSMNAVQTEGVVTRYNDFGQPMEYYQYEGVGSKSPVAHDTTLLVPSSDYHKKASLTYDAATHNIAKVSESAKPDVAYLWGYNGSRVVASATGASVDRLFYTSFEETGTEGNSKTGTHYYNGGSYTLSTADFNPSSTTGLRMSYWYWNGTQWIFSGDIPFSRTISNGSRLDEIRVYPSGAQMTTLTYDLCCGVKTVTDPNSLTTVYEYDDLSRLQRIRDHQGNIVKEIKYHYYNNND